MLDSVNNPDAAPPGAATFSLDGYTDIQKIGTGGMANVYRGMQSNFQRQVAIKVLLPAYSTDAEFAQRFLREAQTVSQLSHPHIIPVYDFGQKDGSFYMVMELLPGGDLATWVKRGLEESETLDILLNIASALHFAHEKGFVHRDVKPDNVMFREDNSAVLTDFGIARKQNAENQVTVAGQVLGTPRYMSPEQLQGREIDGRSDIYSLGIMFYEMLCKKAPYDDEDFMVLAMKHIQAPIPTLPKKFARYQKFFERMVAKSPEHRFQSCLEIVKVLQKVRSGQLDVSNVDSGRAASLKEAMDVNEGELAEEATGEVSAARLARNMMLDLRDVDPLLDLNWNAIVTDAFTRLNANERKFVYAQILKPKGILYDSKEKQFVFYGRKSVADVMKDSVNAPPLQVIGKKVMQAQQSLQGTRDAAMFADIMEGALSAVDAFDAEDSLAVQQEKNLLRNALIDDLITLVRNAELDVPHNRRSLTEEGIKAYMLDVFLKQQMIGYRFKTTTLTTLDSDPHDFIRDVISPEARTRQCDVVRTEKYIYVIGPVRNIGLNPYSIRRFLIEEEAMGGQVIYFNVVALPIDKMDNPKAQETMQWLMSRIVTLERQLSQSVFNFVVALEKTREQYLLPALKKAISADGASLDEAIDERIQDFEKKLCMLVLGKLPATLSELAKTLDEFEYLFFNIRKLLIDLACEVRDFAMQSATSLNIRAEEIDMRMMSYIRLLEKRKDDIFTVARRDDDPGSDHTLMIEEIINTLNTHEKEIEVLTVKLREVIRKQAIEKSAFKKFMEKIFGEPKNKEPTPDEVQGQISAAKRRCLLSMIRIVKRYPKVTVYLELEDIILVNPSVRHYALSMGKDGIARLPLLLTLYESSDRIDIQGLRENLIKLMQAA